ncbi:hypothetical protein [Kitasatospora sp. NPDC048407]
MDAQQDGLWVLTGTERRVLAERTLLGLPTRHPLPTVRTARKILSVLAGG